MEKEKEKRKKKEEKIRKRKDDINMFVPKGSENVSSGESAISTERKAPWFHMMDTGENVTRLS